MYETLNTNLAGFWFLFNINSSLSHGCELQYFLCLQLLKTPNWGNNDFWMLSLNSIAQDTSRLECNTGLTHETVCRVSELSSLSHSPTKKHVRTVMLIRQIMEMLKCRSYKGEKIYWTLVKKKKLKKNVVHCILSYKCTKNFLCSCHSNLSSVCWVSHVNIVWYDLTKDCSVFTLYSSNATLAKGHFCRSEILIFRHPKARDTRNTGNETWSEVYPGKYKTSR